ncbi:TPA: sugar kinase [Klebsiella pneumoniae]|nr:sugar kinase [Klebsiella pneumoniae]
MSKKIAVIGECMIELSEKNGAVNRGFGGDTLNTSVYIARQTDASALSVHYVTALGTDAFSQQMLDSWQQENVNTDLIQRMADRLPGLYYIETDDTGERTFYYWRNEAAAKFWLESDRAAAICEELATFDYLYLSGISLAILSPASRDKLFTLLREVPAVRLAKEKVVDTTAAGDSFSAGYLAVRLTGGDAESAARRGHLTASTVIQYRGAIIPREAMPQ